VWLKLVIGTIQEKLRRDSVVRVRDSDSTGVKKIITYPFMRFLKVDPVNRFKTAHHGFLRITQTSQNPVCNAKTSEYAIIGDIKALGN
jgi:hypothetical protein